MGNNKMPSMLIKGGKGVKEIVGNDKSREKLCASEINGILGRYDCTLVPKFTMTPGNVMGTVEVTAIPREIGGIPQ